MCAKRKPTSSRPVAAMRIFSDTELWSAGTFFGVDRTVSTATLWTVGMLSRFV
jgi:hypothetical protein